MAATRKRKRKKKKKKGSTTGEFRSTGKDPLQSFNDGDVNLDGLGGGDDEGGEEEEYEDDEMPDFSGDGGGASKKQKTGSGDANSKVFTSTRDGTGSHSTERRSEGGRRPTGIVIEG